jgi:hypothetical protein
MGCSERDTVFRVSSNKERRAATMDCAGGKGARGRGRGRSKYSSQRSVNHNEKNQEVLGFPCKKPVRVNDSLKPAFAESSKNEINGRSEKAAATSPSLLGAPTPEKKNSQISSSRVKNRGVAMSIKEVVNQAKQQLLSSSGSTAQPNTIQQSESISIHPKTPNPTNFKLPDKYAMLAEFFDSMEAAIRLLRLRKANSSFHNICPQVETMTHKRFIYSHVAQMKHIFPEGMLLEKTMVHDEKTLCMKPDLKITLLHDAVASGKDKASKGNNTLGLRKAFHTRLVEFVKVYPKGDDVPEAILPEPFNRKCQLTSPGSSPLPPMIGNSLSPARGAASGLPDNHQGESKPSMMSSLLPKNFQRRFSQRTLTPQPSVDSSFPVPKQDPILKPQSEVPETEKPNGGDGASSFPVPTQDPILKPPSEVPETVKPNDAGGGHPSSLHSHFSPGFRSRFAARFYPLESTQDIKESNEIDCKLSTCNKTDLASPISKSCCTPQLSHSHQIPSKIPNPVLIAEGTIDVDTPCKAVQVSENASSPMTTGCFSPVTPGVIPHSIELKNASDVSAADKTPVVKSILKSNIKSPMSKKSLRFGSVSNAPNTSSPIWSPGTPGFASPESSRISQSSVKKSKNSNVKRSIAFNRPVKDSSILPASEQPQIRSTLKRKAKEANLDDDLPESFQSAQSLALCTPVKSSEGDYYVDSTKPSPLREAASLFAISKKNKKAIQNPTCSPQHHRKAFSLENIPEKGVLDTPPLHAPKRLRFSVDEPHTLQVEATKTSSQTGSPCFQCPKINDVEHCKLDTGRASIVSEKAEKTSIDGMSLSDWQILQSLPMQVVQEVFERESKSLEDCKLGVSAAKRRQQMIGCLPKLFNMIRDIFRSSKRSVLTRQELVHKIISNHTDVTDRSEVVEQLHLLQDLAPDWISERTASTGDFLYSVQNNIDVQRIHARFASAA